MKLVFENVSSNILCSRIDGKMQELDVLLLITEENKNECVKAYNATGKLKVTVEIEE